MSDAIRYCKNCETNVMCHLERKCMRQALGLSSAAVSGSDTPKTDELSFMKPTHSMWREAHEELERENALLKAANDDVHRISMERNRLEDALKNMLRRHEQETDGGEPISGEEWEIASYALPFSQNEKDHS